MELGLPESRAPNPEAQNPQSGSMYVPKTFWGLP